MSLIVIGDIHGHLSSLDDLLSKIESASPEEVVFLGDYIDRGADNLRLRRFEDLLAPLPSGGEY